jgi:hypothetical protein
MNGYKTFRMQNAIWSLLQNYMNKLNKIILCIMSCDEINGY